MELALSIKSQENYSVTFYSMNTVDLYLDELESLDQSATLDDLNTAGVFPDVLIGLNWFSY